MWGSLFNHSPTLRLSGSFEMTFSSCYDGDLAQSECSRTSCTRSTSPTRNTCIWTQHNGRRFQISSSGSAGKVSIFVGVCFKLTIQKADFADYFIEYRTENTLSWFEYYFIVVTVLGAESLEIVISNVFLFRYQIPWSWIVWIYFVYQRFVISYYYLLACTIDRTLCCGPYGEGMVHAIHWPRLGSY